MRAGALMVLVAVGCGGTEEVDLGPSLLKPAKTITLAIGGYGQQGDGIDLTTDEVFGPTGPSDFMPTRDRDYTMARVGCNGCLDLVDVGPVGSLEEVPLPPEPPAQRPTWIPAVVGQGYAIRGHSGCPAAVRIRETQVGPLDTATDAFLGATIEYASLDCSAVTITISVNTEPGTCPPGTTKAGPGLLRFEVDGLASPFDPAKPPAFRVARGETVLLGSWFPGGSIEWSGDCQGAVTCMLEVHRDQTVRAKIDVPHYCVPLP